MYFHYFGPLLWCLSTVLSAPIENSLQPITETSSTVSPMASDSINSEPRPLASKRLSEAKSLGERERWLLDLKKRMLSAQREYAEAKEGNKQS